MRSDTALPSRLTCPPGTSRFSAASLLATAGSGRLERLEAPRIEVDLHLAHLAAVHLTAATPSICSSSGLRSSSTWRRVTSRGCDEPTAKVMIGSAATSNRSMVGSSICSRQPVADGGHLLAHFRGGGLRIDFEPQLDADAREALGRRRDHALDAVDAGHRVLDRPGDQRLDFFRRRAGIDHRDVHEGEVHLGKQIDAEPGHRHHAQHHEAHDEHRREDGTLDGCIGNPHDFRSTEWERTSAISARRRRGPSRRRRPARRASATTVSPAARPLDDLDAAPSVSAFGHRRPESTMPSVDLEHDALAVASRHRVLRHQHHVGLAWTRPCARWRTCPTAAACRRSARALRCGSDGCARPLPARSRRARPANVWPGLAWASTRPSCRRAAGRLRAPIRRPRASSAADRRRRRPACRRAWRRRRSCARR